MNGPDGIGLADHQMLVTAGQVLASEVVGRKVLALKMGARRAVEDDDFFLKDVVKGGQR
ncbi:MAG: hypothetical protein HBSIN02_20970 [Bacteroidia bacterium]|nr:MAG: hypothetical protein HBSIN02_20970 [Bacteroidia bacterium]